MARSIVQSFRVAARATVEETRKAHVETAKRLNAEIMKADPRPSRFIRSVDGKIGAREETVKAGGVITYTYPRLDEVVQAAMELLFDLSPVLSGEYRKGHTLFVDGAQARNLKDWDGRGEIVISNMLPYSRKIEAGKMTMRVKGTDHVYEQAEFVLRKRFGNQARIKFTFRGIVGGSMVNQSKAASSGQPWWLGDGDARAASGVMESAIGKKYGKTAHNRSNARFPALVIEAR